MARALGGYCSSSVGSMTTIGTYVPSSPSPKQLTKPANSPPKQAAWSNGQLADGAGSGLGETEGALAIRTTGASRGGRFAGEGWERPVPADAVAFGEIALSGEIRPVAHAPLRLKEAGKLGFERAMLPAGAKAEGGVKVSGFKTLAQLVDHLLGR